MSDDTYYITTHEAALAVVATAMKKSRLRIDTLVITSVLGGILFSVGGMLFVQVQAGLQGEYENNPGTIQLLQGAVYPIGLFYVVIMGTDLFNSNVLFFTVGLLRGAVTVLDLLISWFTSFFCNLLGNLLVAYVICHLSKSTTNADWQLLSIQIVDKKLSYSFVENMLKGIPSNFLVCLAIYLQLMLKPIHVKFLMMFFPVFTLVAMGFNHVVADMFVVPLCLLNGTEHSVKEYIWKLMIPSTIGNIIGGCVFAVLIPWYLHLIVVEMDKKKLNLPEYEERDEQPEQGMDSRVVKVPSLNSTSYTPTSEDISFEKEKTHQEEEVPVPFEPIRPIDSHISINSTRSTPSLSRTMSQGSNLRPIRTINLAERMRSPKGVFPVMGMGAPYKKERRLTDAYLVSDDEDDDQGEVEVPNKYDPDQEKVSSRLNSILTRRGRTNSNTIRDIESRPRAASTASSKSQIFKNNFNLSSSTSNDDYYAMSKRASKAGLTKNSVRMSDDIAGIYPLGINVDHHKTVDAALNSKKKKEAKRRQQRLSIDLAMMNDRASELRQVHTTGETDPLDESHVINDSETQP